MADITDPTAVRFVVETIRPFSEVTRGWEAECESIEDRWYGGINLLFPNDDTVVDEGIEDGRIQLTGADIHSIMSVLIAMRAQYNAQIIEKACIRPLRTATG